MTIPVVRRFSTHEDARHAAARLAGAGIAPDQVSLVDEHRGEVGGTVLTVQASDVQAAQVAKLLPDGAVEAGPAAPPDGMAQLRTSAPAYAAGADANIGTPGSG